MWGKWGNMVNRNAPAMVLAVRQDAPLAQLSSEVVAIKYVLKLDNVRSIIWPSELDWSDHHQRTEVKQLLTGVNRSVNALRCIHQRTDHSVSGVGT